MMTRRAVALLASVCLAGCAAPDATYSFQRARLVELIRRDVRSKVPEADDRFLEAALGAVATVPRERFVPARDRSRSYSEIPLPIGYAQTITDAGAIAVMVAAARLGPAANVLDIGTGSGYQAAVLSRLAKRVSSIEIVKPLAVKAARCLKRLGYGNVEVRTGDGYAGWPERAPFDAIIVAAGAAVAPKALLDQLGRGGHLVMPIGPSWSQEQLLVYTKGVDGRYERCSLGWTMFVPLTGEGERSPGSSGLFDRSIGPCYSGSLISPVFVPAPGAQGRDAFPDNRQPAVSTSTGTSSH